MALKLIHRLTWTFGYSEMHLIHALHWSGRCFSPKQLTPIPPHGRQLWCLAQERMSMCAGGAWDGTTNLQVTYRALHLSCGCPTWILAFNLMYFLCFPVDGVLCQNIHVSVFIPCPSNWARGGALLVCLFDVTLGWNLIVSFFPLTLTESVSNVTVAPVIWNCYSRACVAQSIPAIDYLNPKHYNSWSLKTSAHIM